MQLPVVSIFSFMLEQREVNDKGKTGFHRPQSRDCKDQLKLQGLLNFMTRRVYVPYYFAGYSICRPTIGKIAIVDRPGSDKCD